MKTTSPLDHIACNCYSLEMEGQIYAAVYLFDLFGTLLIFSDFDRTHRMWRTAFHESAGRPNGFSFEQSEAIGNRILHSDSTKDEGSRLSTYETKIAGELRRLEISVSRNELSEIADRTLSAWQADIKPAADAEQVLSALRAQGRKTALVTNFDHSPHVRRLLEMSGLRSLFDLVVISDEIGCRKPDPMIFRVALKQLGAPPDEVVHIGDSIHDDVQGAAAAGIEPILIDRNVKSNEDDLRPPMSVPKDIRIIRSLSELLN